MTCAPLRSDSLRWPTAREGERRSPTIQVIKGVTYSWRKAATKNSRKSLMDVLESPANPAIRYQHASKLELIDPAWKCDRNYVCIQYCLEMIIFLFVSYWPRLDRTRPRLPRSHGSFCFSAIALRTRNDISLLEKISHLINFLSKYVCNKHLRSFADSRNNGGRLDVHVISTMPYTEIEHVKLARFLFGPMCQGEARLLSPSQVHHLHQMDHLKTCT